MLTQYMRVLVLLGIGLVFPISNLIISFLVRDRSDRKDVTAYECGMDAVGTPWNSPNIRFYIFCLLFVIFDVEALFVFPWAVQFRALGMEGFVAVLIFVATLFVGLVYAWKKGALKWE